MTLPSISPRIPRIAFALVVAAFAAVSCGSNGVGRPCEVGTTPLGGASGQIVTVASPALECPSRVCLLPGADNPQGTGALCTAACESDRDCEDAAAGRPGDSTDPRCKNGFACAWPTTVGAFACQKMCVCRDFVAEPAGGFPTPASCP